jgi:hypothetical protein
MIMHQLRMQYLCQDPSRRPSAYDQAQGSVQGKADDRSALE